MYKYIHTYTYVTTAKIKVKSRFPDPRKLICDPSQSVNPPLSWMTYLFHHRLFYLCLNFM